MSKFTDSAFNETQKPSTNPIIDNAWVKANIAGFKIPESFSCLKDIQDIVCNLISSQRGYALRVIDNLYFYNSKVKIVRDENSDIQLLFLPEAEVIIDFFHDKKEDFIGNENVKFNEDGNFVIAEPYDTGYIYYTLNEALLTNQVLQSVCELEPWRKRKIEKGIIVDGVSSKLQKSILDIMFHGNHNWACNTSYSEMKKELEYNLLPYQVLCYENDAYLKDVGNYYIETEGTLESEDEFRVLEAKGTIAIFANHPVNQGTGDLRFYGYFEIDAEKSKELKHVSFKRIQTVFG